MYLNDEELGLRIKKSEREGFWRLWGSPAGEFGLGGDDLEETQTRQCLANCKKAVNM